MKIGRLKIGKAAYGKRFYWLPRRLTLATSPAIYRWGHWNFTFSKEVD